MKILATWRSWIARADLKGTSKTAEPSVSRMYENFDYFSNLRQQLLMEKGEIIAKHWREY